MTPEKQRIAIAEACGWKCFGHPDQILATKNWQFAYQFVISPTGEIVSHNSIPDYLSDLNAMQSSVQSQSERFQDDFDSALKNSSKWVASMTAQEWADIFILCLQSQRDSGNSTP